MKQARFSATGLLVAGFENQINVFELQDRKLVFKHSLVGHEKSIQFLQWDREGKFLVSVSDDSVHVWEPAKQAHLNSYQGPPNKYFCSIFHPQTSSSVLIGSFESLIQWDWHSGTLFLACNRLHTESLGNMSGPVPKKTIHAGIISSISTCSSAFSLSLLLRFLASIYS